jgi:hypothetical protein
VTQRVRVRRLEVCLAAGIALMAALELIYGWIALGYANWWGFDLDIYRSATSRLLAGGSWFLDRQLAGPYQIANGDVLYPPVAALVFAPFLVLPTIAFTVVPICIVAWCIWRWHPQPIALAVIAVCLAWPTTQMRMVSANPAVWIAASVALGLRFRWPAAFVLIKPSLGPLALIGIRSRGWWLAIATLALASVPFLGPTLDYPRVLLDSRGGGLSYSLPDLPIMAIPLAAWFGRRRPDLSLAGDDPRQVVS